MPRALWRSEGGWRFLMSEVTLYPRTTGGSSVPAHRAVLGRSIGVQWRHPFIIPHPSCPLHTTRPPLPHTSRPRSCPQRETEEPMAPMPSQWLQRVPSPRRETLHAQAPGPPRPALACPTANLFPDWLRGNLFPDWLRGGELSGLGEKFLSPGKERLALPLWKEGGSPQHKTTRCC